jgi:hypothetical protein
MPLLAPGYSEASYATASTSLINCSRIGYPKKNYFEENV